MRCECASERALLDRVPLVAIDNAAKMTEVQTNFDGWVLCTRGNLLGDYVIDVLLASDLIRAEEVITYLIRRGAVWYTRPNDITLVPKLGTPLKAAVSVAIRTCIKLQEGRAAHHIASIIEMSFSCCVWVSL